MKEQTGGPAFPIHPGAAPNGGPIREVQGMSLRDYFAAKAVQGLIGGDFEKFEHVAKDAYAVADAMLKVRGN